MDTVTADERRTLSIEEAAEVLGVGRSLMYDAAKRGEIPVIKIGRRLVVPRARLEAGRLDEQRGVASVLRSLVRGERREADQRQQVRRDAQREGLHEGKARWNAWLDGVGSCLSVGVWTAGRHGRQFPETSL